MLNKIYPFRNFLSTTKICFINFCRSADQDERGGTYESVEDSMQVGR